ncbi:hypothetical protein C6558_24000 [Ensifer sp. NM-2]|uniref:winged helix-turn-helix transcriptional regulator n=1 Tax=Ensifer TaxID=106591 RepID=UPI0009EAF709|nr:hypothetical protein [Ensifer canadensis]PSS62229.1 hypothetical protein C6558_24000 [Ensifer sp. NM-2]
MILYDLLKGTLRSNALKRELGDRSQRLLIKQLRELEEVAWSNARCSQSSRHREVRAK